jgi:hypothetical protein
LVVRPALAKLGNGPALRLCMDRIYPARKDWPVRFGLPPLEKVVDAVAANSRSSSTATRERSRQQISPQKPAYEPQ